MRRFFPLALLLLFFCIGCAAGAWVSIKRRASVFAAGVELRLAGSDQASLARTSQPKLAFASDKDLLSAIMSAVSEQAPLLRAHRLHDLLGSLSSAEFAVLFARTVQVEDRERRGLLLNALLKRWATVDYAGAVAVVRPYRDRWRQRSQGDWRSVDFTVAQAWAQARPEAALAEAMTTPDAPWSLNTAYAALRSLANGDPAGQLDALARLPAHSLRDGLCRSALEELAKSDSAAAEARLDLLTDPRTRALTQSEILGKLTERDPTTGLARLAALASDLTPGTNGIRIVTAVLRAAGKRDANAALQAIEDLPEELRAQALGPALVGWAEAHPIDALSWAATNGVRVSEANAAVFLGDNGSGWQTLLSTAFESDRMKTLAWVRTQPVSPERDAMLTAGLWSGAADDAVQIFEDLSPSGKVEASGQVVRALLPNGDKSAANWVRTLPPGPAREKAIQSFAMSQTYHDNEPAKLDQLVEAWPARADRDAALRGITQSLSQSNPRRALDYARRVTDPSVCESALETLAQSWFYRDPISARTWITAAPELSSEKKRVLLRQFDEE